MDLSDAFAALTWFFGSGSCSGAGGALKGPPRRRPRRRPRPRRIRRVIARPPSFVEPTSAYPPDTLASSLLVWRPFARPRADGWTT